MCTKKEHQTKTPPLIQTTYHVKMLSLDRMGYDLSESMVSSNILFF